MKNNIPAELRNAAGIYEIRNLVNGKVYVGSTVGFSQRQRCHKSDLRRHRQTNGRLFNAYLKYGIDAFAFSVLYVMESKDGESKQGFADRLLEMEFEYIKRLGANKRETGYNIRIDPNTNFGAKLLRRPIANVPPTPNQGLGSNHYMAIINEDIAKEIKLMLSKGGAPSNIAASFQINKRIVTDIRSGHSWKHISLSPEEVTNYRLPELSRGKGSRLNAFEVKQVRFLLSFGFAYKPISLFLGISPNAPKQIKLGKGYQDTPLLEGEATTLEKSKLLGEFELFLSKYKADWRQKLISNTQGKGGKLTEKQVLEIRNLLLIGNPPTQIAKIFKVSVDNIRRIANGDTWSHITGLKSGDVIFKKGKLSDKQIVAIRQLLQNGISAKALSVQFGVTPEAIYYHSRTQTNLFKE